MQSRTSSFNKGIYASNLKRFWPVAFAFAFLLTLIILNFLRFASDSVLGNNTTINRFSIAREIFRHNGIVSMLLFPTFSLISALAVFSYIHYQHSTAMIHALPVTRKSLFITNYLSGLTLVMLPLLFAGTVLVVGELLEGITHVAYSFLWVFVSAVFLFLWYSFAVFAGMFTGHMAAHALYFFIFNFLAVFLESTIESVLSSLLFGYVIPYGSPFTPLSPIIYLEEMFYDVAAGELNYAVLACYILAGVAFTLGAGAIYRRRHMESAGDVVSVKSMKPVFKYSVAFCSAALLASIVVEFMNYGNGFPVFLISYLIGGFIGYFAAEMLLRKTFRVFRHIKGFLVFSLVLVLFLSAINFDLFGYTAYIPDPEDVEIMHVGYYRDEYATIALDPEQYNPEKHWYLFAENDYRKDPPSELDEYLISMFRQKPGVLEEPESIRKATDLHRIIVKNADTLKRRDLGDGRYYYDVSSGIRYINLTFTYRLKNGRTVERAYYIPYGRSGGELETGLRNLLATEEFMEKLNPMIAVGAEDINLINVVFYDEKGTVLSLSDTRDKEEFLAAYRKDIMEADPVDLFLGRAKTNPTNVQVTLYFKEGKAPVMDADGRFYITGTSRTFTLWTDHRNTLSFLATKSEVSQDLLQEFIK